MPRKSLEAKDADKPLAAIEERRHGLDRWVAPSERQRVFRDKACADYDL
jgi:hypothetical protein